MESLSSYYFAISGDHFYDDDIDLDYIGIGEKQPQEDHDASEENDD